MSEKVLHRVERTEVMEGWSVKEIDGGPVGFVTVAHYDNGYSVGRDALVYEFARLAARVAELEAANAKLSDALLDLYNAHQDKSFESLLRSYGRWTEIKGMVGAASDLRAALDAKGDGEEPKRRPKVRYAVDKVILHEKPVYWIVEEVHDGYGIPECRAYGERRARRIAAALNVYEARRRGEL